MNPMKSKNVSLYEEIVFLLRFLSCGRYSDRKPVMPLAKSVASFMAYPPGSILGNTKVPSSAHCPDISGYKAFVSLTYCSDAANDL